MLFAESPIPSLIKLRNFKGTFFGMNLKVNAYHLVDSSTVCPPKSEGGLGIKSLVCMNKALLGKWLWRFGIGVQSLWRDVVLWKYGISSEGRLVA